MRGEGGLKYRSPKEALKTNVEGGSGGGEGDGYLSTQHSPSLGPAVVGAVPRRVLRLLPPHSMEDMLSRTSEGTAVGGERGVRAQKGIRNRENRENRENNHECTLGIHDYFPQTRKPVNPQTGLRVCGTTQS